MKTTKKFVVVLITAVTAMIMFSCEEFSNDFPLIDPPTVDENSEVIFQLPAASPVMADIPDQTIIRGQDFCCINLDQYVSDPDNSDCDMCWRCSGNNELIVTINSDCRMVTIELPWKGWTGSETIRFIVKDPDGNIASDLVTFTVKERDVDDLQRVDGEENIEGLEKLESFIDE